MISCSVILIFLGLVFVGLGCPRGTYNYNAFDYTGALMFFSGIFLFIGRVLYLCWVHLP